MNIIMGAGDFAKEVYEYCRFCNLQVDGFFDEKNNLESFKNKPVYKSLKDIKNIEKKYFLVGTGNPKINKYFLDLVRQNNLNLAEPLICDSYIGNNVSILKGTVICPKSVITCDINIGNFVVINICTTIGHDSILEDCCVLSPNVSLSGHTHLAEEVFFGTGALTAPRVFVKNNTIVGANSTVLKSIEESGTYFGNPTKRYK